MPSPFPGMDPFLEDPFLWPDVHHELIAGVRAQLNPKLRPRYVARVEQYTYLVDPDEAEEDAQIVPDLHVVERAGGAGGGGGTAVAVEAEVTPSVDVTGRLKRVVRQRYLEIREPRSREVVTCIEVVSPANKRAGAQGRLRFEERREKVRATPTGWVEIDLLRRGRPPSSLPFRRRPPYYVLIDRHDPNPQGPRRQLAWPVLRVPDRLPTIAVPLRLGERDVPLDLQAVLDKAYDQAAYDASIDYAADPPPPALAADDAAWLDGLLREAGLRPGAG